MGIISAIMLTVILAIAHVCDGYVAGRIARFDGAQQNIAVRLWAILIAIILAILGAVTGSPFNLLGQLNGFPRIPVGEGTPTTGDSIAMIITGLVPLLGAVLGGIAGMGLHRKIDRVGINHQAGLTG